MCAPGRLGCVTKIADRGHDGGSGQGDLPCPALAAPGNQVRDHLRPVQGWPPARRCPGYAALRRPPARVTVAGAQVQQGQEDGELVGRGAAPGVDDLQQAFSESGVHRELAGRVEVAGAIMPRSRVIRHQDTPLRQGQPPCAAPSGGLGYLPCPFPNASWSATGSPRSSPAEGRHPVTRVLDQAGLPAFAARQAGRRGQPKRPGRAPRTFLVNWPTCWKCSAP